MEAQTHPIETLHDLFVKIISKKDEFPIDFDEAWQWIGYSSKHKALEMLEKNFILEQEFSPVGVKTSGEKGGRPATHIMLTADCFKAFCMLAQTERGKEVRRYYIQLEKDVRMLGMKGAHQKHYGSDERRELVSEIEAEKISLGELKKELKKIDKYNQAVDLELSIARNQKRLRKLTNEAIVQFNIF